MSLLEQRPELVARLQTNAAALRSELGREGFELGDSRTQIVPIVIGDAELTVEVCERALERGVFAQAIRPPTVAPMTSRLRLAVMASHRAAELREAARLLAEAVRATGLEPHELAFDDDQLEYDAVEYADQPAPAPAAARDDLRRRGLGPARRVARARAVRDRHRHGRRQDRAGGRDCRRAARRRPRRDAR